MIPRKHLRMLTNLRSDFPADRLVFVSLKVVLAGGFEAKIDRGAGVCGNRRRAEVLLMPSGLVTPTPRQQAIKVEENFHKIMAKITD